MMRCWDGIVGLVLGGTAGKREGTCKKGQRLSEEKRSVRKRVKRKGLDERWI